MCEILKAKTKNISKNGTTNFITCLCESLEEIKKMKHVHTGKNTPEKGTNLKQSLGSFCSLCFKVSCHHFTELLKPLDHSDQFSQWASCLTDSVIHNLTDADWLDWFIKLTYNYRSQIEYLLVLIRLDWTSNLNLKIIFVSTHRYSSQWIK